MNAFIFKDVVELYEVHCVCEAEGQTAVTKAYRNASQTILLDQSRSASAPTGALTVVHDCPPAGSD